MPPLSATLLAYLHMPREALSPLKFLVVVVERFIAHGWTQAHLCICTFFHAFTHSQADVHFLVRGAPQRTPSLLHMISFQALFACLRWWPAPGRRRCTAALGHLFRHLQERMATIITATEALLPLLTVPLAPPTCVSATVAAFRQWVATIHPASDAGLAASCLAEAVDAMRDAGAAMPELHRCMAIMHSHWMHAGDLSLVPEACRTLHMQLAQGTGDAHIVAAVVRLQQTAHGFADECFWAAAACDVSLRDIQVHLSRLCGVGVDRVNKGDTCMRTAPTITVRPCGGAGMPARPRGATGRRSQPDMTALCALLCCLLWYHNYLER